MSHKSHNPPHADEYSHHFLVEFGDGEEIQPSYDSKYEHDDSVKDRVFMEHQDATSIKYLGASHNY